MYFDQRGQQLPFRSECSLLWRGYRGTWEIREQHLYLLRLEIGRPGGALVAPESLFAGVPGPVFANWYTGTLNVVVNHLRRRVAVGYPAADHFIHVVKGVVAPRFRGQISHTRSAHRTLTRAAASRVGLQRRGVPTTVAIQLTSSREETLLREFSVAIAATSTHDLKAWGRRTAGILGEVTIRRGKNFGTLVAWIWNFMTKETEDLLDAILHKRTVPHLKARAAVAHNQAHAVSRDFASLYDILSSNLQNRPKETAPKLVAGALGFLVGSGGVQGDGGIPDLDFLGGIGTHRSILTHSVVAGVVVETLVLGILDLSRTVYRNLPENHDPMWEDLNAASGEVFAALSTGLSAGIAYHLAVDATIDGGGTYKDLPVALPEIGHQAILATNSVVEGFDAGKRVVERKSEEVDGRVFNTFREAAEFAKQERGWVIVRAVNGHGFRVYRKNSGKGTPSLAKR